MVATEGIWVRLMHEFWVLKLFRADRNEHIQTTILGPRIMLELVSPNLLDALSRLQLGTTLGCRNFFGPIATNGSKQLF